MKKNYPAGIDKENQYFGFDLSIEHSPKNGFFIATLFAHVDDNPQANKEYLIQLRPVSGVAMTIRQTYQFEVELDSYQKSFKNFTQDASLIHVSLGLVPEMDLINDSIFYLKGAPYIFMNDTSKAKNAKNIGYPIESVDVVAGRLLLITTQDREIYYYDIVKNIV